MYGECLVPPMTAATADPFRLYEQSVQDTETTISLIETVFKKKNGRFPTKLREDFCGTAKLCADWVKTDPKRTAVGLDIDAPTLAWAFKNNIAPLGSQAKKVELVAKDVRQEVRGKFDVIVAFNFSYWIFHKREELAAYFKAARRCLKPGGVLLLDLHGGPDAQFALEEQSDFDDFTYVWEQDIFDPINNRAVCHIHFRFKDDTEIKDAFSYDWRIWSLPEVKDVLHDAGFKMIETWWDGDDDILRPSEEAENRISWIAYLASWR